MTKKITKLSAFIAAFFMCLLLVACEKQPDPIVGTWKFYSMTVSTNGLSLNLTAGLSYNGIILDENYLTLEAKEDKTFTMTTSLTIIQENSSVTGTWKKDGEQYILEAENEPQTVTVNGNVLVIEESEDDTSIKIVLEKK